MDGSLCIGKGEHRSRWKNELHDLYNGMSTEWMKALQFWKYLKQYPPLAANGEEELQYFGKIG